MTNVHGRDGQLGVAFANLLNLKLGKREGHDLTGPCIACKSSDAFRLHMRTGVAHCFSCGGKWSPFQVAEAVLRDREQAKALLIEVGFFKPSPNSDEQLSPIDPIEWIARQKGITVESLKAFGARVTSPMIIELPAYGPDGKQCTTFTMSTSGGKGLFGKGKPAGLFFPHDGDKVQLPHPGETCCLVEGPKDAPALHAIGYLACGLNTCRLAAKFARLFTGVHVILIPDRDRAGEEGAKHSASVLRGVAKSIRIAVLPSEFKESGGSDVRDILRQPDGEQLLRQAIEDAQVVDDGYSETQDAIDELSCEIEMPDGEPIKLTVFPADSKSRRIVSARQGKISHRDRFNTDSAVSRGRFTKNLAAKLGVSAAKLRAQVDSNLTDLGDHADKQTAGVLGIDAGERDSQATIIANTAAAWDVWHTPGGDAYATVPVRDHLETWPVKSKTFKRYVAKQFFDLQGKAVNSESLSAAINLIEAKAIFDGEEHDVHVRVAEHDGNVILDLCNARWQVVTITALGWLVTDESPVRFRRSRGMLPLPDPEKGGSVELLWNFLNVGECAWRLIVAWLLAALRRRGPYPLLALFAGQGSGKSVGGRLIRSLVDPNAAPLRSEHREPRDLMIGANNSWCLAYDNLSNLPPWLSDALCRLSTGGGFATRELYTDQDEIIFDSQRPVLLTSIEEVATRADLIDRCLIVWLPEIPIDRRKREEEIDAEFNAVRPKILGALLDAVSGALRELPNTQLPALPRMADFATWVTAAEKSLSWSTGTFLEAYMVNRESANDLALESSPIGPPLLAFVQEHGEWSGTAGELLQALEERVSEQAKRQKTWPKSGYSIANHLKRIAFNMRSAGWDVFYNRSASRRVWSIRPAAETASSASSASHGITDQCNEVQSDANRGKTHTQLSDGVSTEQAGNDAGDSHDAVSQTSGGTEERNDVGWEEGAV